MKGRERAGKGAGERGREGAVSGTGTGAGPGCPGWRAGWGEPVRSVGEQRLRSFLPEAVGRRSAGGQRPEHSLKALPQVTRPCTQLSGRGPAALLSSLAPLGGVMSAR